MSLIEISGDVDELTVAQRWSHLLAIITAVVLILFGVNQRNSVLGATEQYNNVRAGITINFPANWLTDEAGPYVVRVRDMTRIGYKTTILVETVPVNADSLLRDVVNILNVNRPQQLSVYESLSVEDLVLEDDSAAVVMDYTFVDTQTNPFLESLPTVVLGRDIVTIRGTQAILVRFLADANTFDDEVGIFNKLVESLEFQ